MRIPQEYIYLMNWIKLNTELASRSKIDYCKIEPTSRSKNTG